MAQTPKRGLGRGFEALLSPDFDKSLVVNDDERVQKLPIDDVLADSEQPRRHFDATALEELAASIKTHGVLLPLVVTPHGHGKYQIVAGERRWRASKLAGLQTVPAVVRSLKQLERLEIALVENVQRVDLSPIEQAASLLRLHEQLGTPYETIARRLGKASSTINNTVRLLQLPLLAQQALAEHKISEGHARAILALKGQADQQAHLLDLIIRHGWSVREAERYVTSLKSNSQKAVTTAERVATETPETKILAKKLGAPVHVKRTARGGRLEISFKTDEELQQIISRLK